MKKQNRLPEYITPEHYNICFEPDLKKFTFLGKAEIIINVKKRTSEILLHARDLKITKAALLNKKTLTPKISLDEEKQLLSLKFKKRISPGTHTLSLSFSGIINDHLSGFYKSKYTYKGKTKYLATTQFEAPYAREAFPCFDEPDKKATFDISLLIDKKLKAISNMPEKSEKIRGSKKLIAFQTTPIMSTYLLYMGVGEFEYLKGKHRNIDIRIVTTKGKSKEGAFALDLTKKFLKYFEDYSKIKYPLPKLDMLAIPDFSAGAMENWGAITFREILLLFNKKKTSDRIKKRIAEVIAHELWHQWSGNLVTMKWWEDLWLNEAFATYMAFKAVDHYFPKWEMWEDFVDTETTRAFNADSLKSTHPIAVPVHSPNEIEEIFDEISYGKGGSVLRMIDSYLGEETFRKGVAKYLKKYAYKNAEAQDLWNELSVSSKTPIKNIMESWIKQQGHPLIEVKRKKHKLILTQKRYNAAAKQSWEIPLIIQTDKKIIKSLMKKKKQIIPIGNAKWFKINHKQEGFYRVKYDYKSLQVLKKPIKNKKIGIIDRWGLQNELFQLCLTGHLTINHYLDFIKAYENENSNFVLSDIFANLATIEFLFSQTPIWKNIQNKFKNHLAKPFQDSFNKLGWSPKAKETLNNSLLRPTAISYLSFSEDKEIIKQALKKFRSHSNVAPNIKAPVFSIAAKHGTNKDFSILTSRYKKTQDIEEKIKLLASLYKTKNPDLLRQSLDFTLSDHVRSQNLRIIFATINSNSSYRKSFFRWVKSNWKTLKKYEKIHFVFMGILEALITIYTDPKTLKEISAFLKEHKIKYEKTKANSFEISSINSNFIRKNLPVMKRYFS